MSSPDGENLSVKIVTADYYLHKPISDLGDQCYSAFRSSPIYRVPVIRIFGPTSEGNHLHLIIRRNNVAWLLIDS